MRPSERTVRRDIATRIIYWRNKKGLSSIDLGRLLGKSKQTLSRWQNARGAPPLTDVYRIARVCGVSLDEFWGEIPKKVKRVA